MNSNNLDNLKNAIEKLRNSSMEMGRAIYQQQSQQSSDQSQQQSEDKK